METDYPTNKTMEIDYLDYPTVTNGLSDCKTKMKMNYPIVKQEWKWIIQLTKQWQQIIHNCSVVGRS